MRFFCFVEFVSRLNSLVVFPEGSLKAAYIAARYRLLLLTYTAHYPRISHDVQVLFGRQRQRQLTVVPLLDQSRATYQDF